jgi:serine protease Do
MGVSVQPLTPQLADRLEVPPNTAGVVVTGINPDGRAADAGLREGDVIRQVDGKAVLSAADLRAALGGRAERPALVLVQRGETTFFATVG